MRMSDLPVIVAAHLAVLAAVGWVVILAGPGVVRAPNAVTGPGVALVRVGP